MRQRERKPPIFRAVFVLFYQLLFPLTLSDSIPLTKFSEEKYYNIVTAFTKGIFKMDKLKDQKTKSTNQSSKKLMERLAGNSEELCGSVFLHDLLFFTLGFLFSKCHLLFGAYPIGISLVALLPHSTLPALAGSLLGALTLGKGGVIYAAIYLSVFLLRLIMSSDKKSGAPFFGEALLIRMSVALIGGFIAAACEILVRGMELSAMLFGISMILLPPLGVFALSGLFGEKINIGKVLSAKENPLTRSGRCEKDKFDIIFFEISATLILFLTALSLADLIFFGVSAAYVFVGFSTLLVAKRFGALRAGIVGFVTSLGVADIYSVSFALAGLGSGAFFSLGAGYALIVGCGASSLWGYYIAGLSGLFSTLPEYLIAAALVSPLLKNVRTAPPETTSEISTKSAEEMVGTVALSYQNRYSKSIDLLEMSLTSLSSVINDYSAKRRAPTSDEFRSLIVSVAEEHCKNCTGRKFCMIENIRPCMVNMDSIIQKLEDGLEICPEDVNGDTEFCQKAEAVAESINSRVAKLEENAFKQKDANSTSEEYALIAKLINEARCRDEEERAVNTSLTDILTEAIKRGGLPEGIIRAFGTRKKHIILAGEDADGEIISSQKMKKEIESAIGARLSAPEFFRHGRMALMECDSARSFSVSYAKCDIAGEAGEISGDTVSFFESGDDSFYALISDGMGKGDVAHETSQFVSKFLSRALDFGATKETVLHLLNYIIKGSEEECSATVDLFELDLYSGEATFIKSGAAPSFVKRDSSLFRIRSQTAPIGLMKNIDSERIKVEVKSGDYIIMMSDGVVECAEEAAWLIELIANTESSTPTALASEILNAAKKNSELSDDMSVAVIKINSL